MAARSAEKETDPFFPTSLCGVLVLLAGIPPASAGPSFLPSSSPPPHSLTDTTQDLTTHSLTHSLTHSPTHSLTHSLTHSHSQASAETSSLTHSLIHTTHSITDSGSLRSVQRLQKGLRRVWSPLGRLSPQCPETAEGPAARVFAAGPLAGLCPETAEGRSVQRLQKGRRRAWSPRGPRRFCVQRLQKAAVSRDYRRACGARGRRWAGSRRSVQRLQKGLRRAWSPLGPRRFCA